MGVLNLDLVIFGSLVFIYNRIKQIKPDLFFLAQGTSVFLPPDEKDVKDIRKEQEKLSKKGGKKPLMPVKMIKATYDFFSKYQFCIELDIVIMLLICLLGQVVISELLRVFVFSRFDTENKEMNFGFALGLSILLLIIAYYCKSVKIAGWKSQDTKTSFWVAVIASLLILTLFLGFKEFVDFDFQKAVTLQQRHLEFVLSPQKQEEKSVSFSIEIFQLGCILLIGIVTFSSVPTIIRFTSCYAWNLTKTVELQQKEEERAEIEEELKKKKKDDDNPFKEHLDREENLEQGIQKQTNLTIANHKKNMTIFNFSLVLNLITVVLWVAPVANLIENNFGAEIKAYIPFARLGLVILQSTLLLFTIKYQVQVFMFKSFDHIKSLSNDNSEVNYQSVKIKASAYVQSLVYVSFQIFVSIIIPALLAALIFYRIYVNPSIGIPTQLPNAETVQDAGQQQQESGDFIADQTSIMKQIYANIKQYSLFNNYFIETTLSFWLFNYQLINYILKIIFIIITRQSKGI